MKIIYFNKINYVKLILVKSNFCVGPFTVEQDNPKSGIKQSGPNMRKHVLTINMFLYHLFLTLSVF